MVEGVPFALSLPGGDISGLISSCPLFLLSVLLSASSSLPHLERQAEEIFRRVLAQKVVVEGRGSVELLQSLLTYLLWYHHRFDPRTQQYYQLLQLAIGMAADLGLYKRFAKPPPPVKDLNASRALLLCYYLNCGAGILGYDRTDNMQCIRSVRNAAQELARHCSPGSLDKEAPAMVELLYIVAQQQRDRLSVADDTIDQQQQVATRLEDWRKANLNSHTTASLALKSSYHFISAYALLRRSDTAQENIRSSLEKVEELLDGILTCDDRTYLARLGIVEWAHIITSLFLLPRLESALLLRPTNVSRRDCTPRTHHYISCFRGHLRKLEAEVDGFNLAPTLFGWLARILQAVEEYAGSRAREPAGSILRSASSRPLQRDETAYEMVNAFLDDDDGSVSPRGGVSSIREEERNGGVESTTDDFWLDFMSDWLNW
jgi:hypothetical protein